MRHRRSGRKLGLPSDQRRALLKSLTRNLLLNDRIITTETRAKEVRRIVEKLVTIARKGGPEATVEMRLHTRRLVRRFVDSNVDEFVRVPGGPKGGLKIARNPYYVVPRLFEVIAPRYMNRPGGYTRITKVGFRRGDGAPIVLLEFVEGEGPDNVLEPQVEVTQEGRRGLFGLGRRRK
ncbi:MAG TPA: 50S ribosomal protein L17 [Chthonomonadaceae bacterium]|jgi:large subunit ribosomal protein L17|nr:50S ribosomal protein L17 [Chthonomonadaceae bacterium]